MTLIELFDANPLNDLVGSLTLSPDRVIFLGETFAMERFEAHYKRVREPLDITATLDFRPVKRWDVLSIVKELEKIVLEETECVFDVTGGDELALLAMGMVYERYAATRSISMHRFDINNATAFDVVRDRPITLPKEPRLSVKQQVMLYGGKIGGSVSGAPLTTWNFHPDFSIDIEVMWKICREDPHFWNTALDALSEFEKRRESSEDPLHVVIRRDALETAVKHDYDKKNERVKTLLETLDYYCIVELRSDDTTLEYRYMNEQVKNALAKSGNLLELKTLKTAKFLKGFDGKTVYHDALCGVYIDWDGKFHFVNENQFDTLNEIDVMLMRGLTPVFISCKNGTVKEEEL